MIYGFSHKARVFVRLHRKSLPRTNTLAYCKNPSIMDKKSFITLGPGCDLRPGTVGRPYYGVYSKIVDPDPGNCVGEIVARSNKLKLFGWNLKLWHSGGQCYKTFYSHNLQVLVISHSVCPWQAFPALCNI
jgi:hypothetical protein